MVRFVSSLATTGRGFRACQSTMEKTKVAIVGLGTVGSGVARLLLDYGDRTAPACRPHAVAGRSRGARREKGPRLRAARRAFFPADLTRITGNPEITAVAHLVGGLEPARTIMLKLLESGKDVVTANKALLAEHGPELFDRARELGRSIAFEASVAGGIPIIANISQCLSANQIESINAILNGTSNFILTQMEEEGMPYAEAVQEAQRLGYAEADPSMDVDGSDAAQKLAILAHLAFGARVHWSEIPRRGIDTLDVADMQVCQRAGLSHQAAGRCPTGRRRAWNCTFRRRWSRAARRWPKSAGRTTPSAWWATPSAGCSFTAWVPGRCRPPRPWWPT